MPSVEKQVKHSRKRTNSETRFTVEAILSVFSNYYLPIIGQKLVWLSPALEFLLFFYNLLFNLSSTLLPWHWLVRLPEQQGVNDGKA